MNVFGDFLLICTLAGLASGAQIGKLPFGARRERSSIGIVNGTTAPITKFPYMASLMIKGNLSGAGVIIDKRWVLTTAYIVTRGNISDLKFRVGSNKYSSDGQVLEIEKVIVHEKFKMGSWDYDIAVVKVKPIKFGKKVKPITLGTQNLEGGSKVFVSGWGDKDQPGTASKVLLAAKVTVLDWKTCHITYKTNLTPRMMCTFDQDVGPCVRDFGDPLVLDKAVYGLFCGGYGCTPGKNPVLYSNVAAHHEWVNKTISNFD